jgi:hypothetical protein
MALCCQITVFFNHVSFLRSFLISLLRRSSFLPGPSLGHFLVKLLGWRLAFNSSDESGQCRNVVCQAPWSVMLPILPLSISPSIVGFQQFIHFLTQALTIHCREPLPFGRSALSPTLNFTPSHSTYSCFLLEWFSTSCLRFCSVAHRCTIVSVI